MEPPDDDDTRAFRQAVADVRPLARKARTTTAAGTRPRPKAERPVRAEVLRENPIGPTEPANLDAGDEQSYRRPHVREDALRRLRRGRVPVDAEIDLHSLTRLAAIAALREFLNDCVLHGVRCVRVIHGKGLRSGPDGPVLKHAVVDCLRRFENVDAYASARPVDGGTGALYVLLRK